MCSVLCLKTVLLVHFSLLKNLLTDLYSLICSKFMQFLEIKISFFNKTGSETPHASETPHTLSHYTSVVIS